jgi:hypothetical protein
VSRALRAFRLRGAAAAAALDWLHVHADLHGVLEHDDGVTVWLAGPLPPLPPLPSPPSPSADVHVEELPVDAAAVPVTGLEHDGPIAVTADLLVRPPWVARPEGFAGVELVVPRGAAFGSGEHDSTKAALRCLHAVWDDPPSFGDVGTGSGILALYAHVRGCASIAACDVDAASVAAARELVPGAAVHLGDAGTMPPVAGMVANMTAAELTASMPAMLRAWARSHALVLSGLRAHEVDAVAALPQAAVVHRETVGAFTALGYRGASSPRAHR